MMYFYSRVQLHFWFGVLVNSWLYDAIQIHLTTANVTIQNHLPEPPSFILLSFQATKKYSIPQLVY